MIPRSYRSLLLQLSRGFSKNDDKFTINKDGKQQQPAADRPKKVFKGKEKNQEREKLKQEEKILINQEKKGNKPVREKVQAEEPREQRKQKEVSSSNINWTKTELGQAKARLLEQQIKARDKFNLLKLRNEVESELLKDIEKIGEQAHQKSLTENMRHYVKSDFNKALDFFREKILTTKQSSGQAKHAVNQVSQAIIKHYIEREDLQGLNNFLATLQIHYKVNQGNLDYGEKKILADLKLISEFEEAPLKYEILGRFLRNAKVQITKPEILKKSDFIIKKVIQNFLDQQTVGEKSVKTFERLLNTVMNNNLIPQKYIKTDAFLSLLETLYFFKSSQKEKYEQFFQLISSVKATIASQDDYLEQFYRRFYAKLIDAQLKTTNAQTTPLKINAKLIEKYKQFFETQNKQGIIAIIAICLSNKYFSIPEHFIQHQKAFLKNFPSTVISSFKEDLSLLQMNENSKAKEGTLIKAKLALDLSQSNRKLTKLKVAIINKNYARAMQIFTKQYFKNKCIKKQRVITEQVLLRVFDSSNIQMHNGELDYYDYIEEKVREFARELGDEYLWTGWQKRQDLGYLFEDYFVREDEHEENENKGISKQEQRFSFWDKYFETKRASEINSYQKQGELNTIKEPNEFPYIEDQFNLNQYLQGENYKRYRQVADYDDLRRVELALYFYKVEAALEELKIENSEKLLKKVVTFQENLCEQNLKVLQQFGLKDYDISVHDIQEFENRLANYKKYRGVLRLNDIYHRVYRNPKYYEPLFTDPKMKKQMEVIMRTFKRGRKPDIQLTQELEQGEIEDIKEAKGGIQVEASQEAQVPEVAVQQEATGQGKQEEQQTQQGEQNVQETAAEGQNLQAQEVPGQSTEDKADIAQISKQHISTKDPISLVQKAARPENLLTTHFLDLLRVRSRILFTEAAVKYSSHPDPIVNELMCWGIIYRQPMAIYMAQKMAMITGQKIPHSLAIRVSDLLSHYREIDEEFFVECKTCLTYIGKIERQFIYDGDKHYQHIGSKPFFNMIPLNFNKPLKDRLEDLVSVSFDLKNSNDQPREILRRASKGPVF